MPDDSGIPWGAQSGDDGTATASAHAELQLAEFPPVRVHPVLTELEDWILAGIGRITMLWAYEEWLLSGIAANYRGYDRKVSRERLTGRADCAIAELCLGFALSKQRRPEVLESITTQAFELAEVRNAVAHGIWIRDQNTGEIGLQWISGAWDDGTPRRRMPQSVPVLPGWFAAQAARIEACIADTRRLKQEVAALARCAMPGEWAKIGTTA